jgi:hypothetical protein
MDLTETARPPKIFYSLGNLFIPGVTERYPATLFENQPHHFQKENLA